MTSQFTIDIQTRAITAHETYDSYWWCQISYSNVDNAAAFDYSCQQVLNFGFFHVQSAHMVITL